MSDLANYGTVYHGTRSVEIYPSNTTWTGETPSQSATLTCVADNITVDHPTTEISRKAADGTENGFVVCQSSSTMSATLQISSALSTDLRGYLIREAFGGATAAVIFNITSVGYAEAIGSEIKLNISARSTTFV
jgi:hypothetical protein